MEIKISNLGVLSEAELELGSLTLLCGKNNTGKTYLSYVLYAFLNFWQENYTLDIPDAYVQKLLAENVLEIPLQDFFQRLDEIFMLANQKFAHRIADVFVSSKEEFNSTHLLCSLSEKKTKITHMDLSHGKMSFSDGENISFETQEKGHINDVLTFIASLTQETKSKLPASSIKQFLSQPIKAFLNQYVPRPFIISAERTGIVLFLEELNFKRNSFIEGLFERNNKMEIDDENFMQIIRYMNDESPNFRYPLPVQDNYKFVLRRESVSQKDSFIRKNHPEILELFAQIAGGSYTLVDGTISFSPKGSQRNLAMKNASSSVRSLPLFSFYLNHEAQQGDLLIIDEPELNLHPENQRLMARLLARLANVGIQVFITTHSDYMIREFDTLIMLHQSSERLQALAKKYAYVAEELLKADKLKVYKTEALEDARGYKIVPQLVKQETGISITTFDDSIEMMNSIQDEIIWGE